MFLLNDDLPLQIGNSYNFQLYHLHYQSQKSLNSALLLQDVRLQNDYMSFFQNCTLKTDQSLHICPKNPEKKKKLLSEHYIP